MSGLSCVVQDLLCGGHFSLVAVRQFSCSATCGILVPQQGVKPALEDGLSTTGLPGQYPFGLSSDQPPPEVVQGRLSLSHLKVNSDVNVNNKRYSHHPAKYRGFRSSVPGTRDGNQIHFSSSHTCQHHILSDRCFCFLRGGVAPTSEDIILHEAAFPSQRWGREGKRKFRGRYCWCHAQSLQDPWTACK